MRTPTRFTSLSAAACAAVLVLAGAPAASAQGAGSLAESGSTALPVFDSRSKASLTDEGEGKYAVSYTNGSSHDLACFGAVLPEDLAHDYYEELAGADWEAALAGEEDLADPELQAEIDAAASAGHMAFITGTDGVGFVDYLRAMIKNAYPDMTDAEVEEMVDMLRESGTYGDLLNDDVKLVNFVDKGTTSTWAAQMGVALPESEKAGGVIICFNGFGSDFTASEVTYVEIEHAGEEKGSILSNVLGSLDIGGSLGF